MSPAQLIAGASAVVFDFDGVLAESVDIKTRAFALLYEDFGPEVVARVVEHHLAYGSVSRFDKIRHYHAAFVGQPLSEADMLAWADRFGAIVEQQVVASPWVAGARALLDRCRQRGQRLFVVSGTPEVELARIVERRGMDHYFEAVRGSPAKKPAIMADLVQRAGLVSASAVMLGDSLGDYEAAASQGLAFVGRVPMGHDNPFPDGIPVVADLTPLVS